MLLKAESAVIGREAELAFVRDFLETPPEGPSALVLEGEAGIGKTTIVQAAIEHAAAIGLRVFFSRPGPGEMELPYSGLADLLEPVGAGAIGALVEPQRVAIERALERTSGPTIKAHTVARGVLELLRTESSSNLLLVVDDLQWLDRPTSTVLTFALRRVAPVPVRVVVAVRTEPEAAAATPLGLHEWGLTRRLPLRALTATDLGALVRERVGVQLSRPRLEMLWRESGGNPLFALELADRPGGAAAVTLPTALQERMSSFDARSRSALSVAAAALRPTSELLLDAGVDRAALRAAVATRVLAVAGERFVFSHPLLRTAAYELLLPEERRDVHSRLAEASSDRVERGYHVARSAVAPDAAAVRALEDAAEEATRLGDHAGAAEFLLRASDLGADRHGEEAWAQRLWAAEAFERAGDVAAAAKLGRGLIGALPRGALRARARDLVAMCSVGEGMSLEEALTEVRVALDEARGDELVLAELHLQASEILLSLCRLEDAENHIRSSIALARRTGATVTEVTALSSLGFLECMLGRGVTEAAHEAFERADPSFLAEHSNYSPQMSLACCFLYTQQYDRAQQLFEQEMKVASETGVEPVEVIARGLLAETQTRAGHWADALANAIGALEHARQAAVGQIVTGSGYMLAMLEALLGRHDRARELASAGVRDADAAEDFWFRIYHRGVLGLLALTEDDADLAVEALEPAWRLMGDSDLGELSIFPVAHVLGEAYVAVGRREEARAIADVLRRCAAGERPWCRAMAARIEGLSAAADGDLDAARALSTQALEAHTDLPEPFEHARMLHLAGRIERSARKWGAARAAFSEALALFDQLGAARWAEKAAADLARLPGRRPASHNGLTKRESEVAELAAAGLGNKEIATRLYVSRRTVEATLTKVYAKLAVRSRTELAGHLRPPRGP